MNFGSFYKGAIANMQKDFKHLKQTPHTHNALDDAKGNAEAMLTVFREFNVQVAKAQRAEMFGE